MYAIEVDNVGRTPAIGRRSVFGDVALLVFLAVQASDGVLTYVGVMTFGPGAEGNPIIAWLMAAMGHGPGLFAAKFTAGVFGVVLHLSNVHTAVAILAAFYVGAAIVPWIAVLFLWG